jgi:hypothetical protein
MIAITLIINNVMAMTPKSSGNSSLTNISVLNIPTILLPD